MTTTPELTSNKQLGFLSALPNDVLFAIFEYLSKQDCLKCMAVCHDWYDAIPQYAQRAWEELLLDEWDADRVHHQTFELFLGNHVKRVTITPSFQPSSSVQEHTLYALLQKLLDWGCTNIGSLDLERCGIMSQSEFLYHLKTLAPQLSRLKMLASLYSVDILNVLDTLPNLTHFTYQYNPCSRVIYGPTIVPSTISMELHTKIRYLWLEIDLTKEQKEAIMRRCPDLRCYIDTSFNIRSLDSLVDLESLFSWCPMLTFFEASNTRHFDDVVSDNETGLRYFHPSSGYTFQQVVQQLRRHKDTLENLSIDNRNDEEDGDGWSSVFTSLHLPKLRTLILSGNVFSSAALVSVVNHSPVLETLHLSCSQLLTLGWTAVPALYSLERLRVLYLHGLHFTGEISLLSFVERFPALEELSVSESRTSLKIPDGFKSLRQLKRLELSNITWESIDEQAQEAAIVYFLQHLTTATSIERIRLSHVHMPGLAPLLPLAGISTLKELNIVLDHTLEDDGLLKFVTMLRKTVIQTLTLRNVNDLPFAVLNRIAELPLLSDLTIERGRNSQRPVYISGKGFRQMLRKSPNLTSVLLFHNTLIVQENDRELTSSQVTTLIGQSVLSTTGQRRWSTSIRTNSNGKRMQRIEVHRGEK
ncbi:hypothetical protein BJV82DRAFT_669884 [Fennellomyces sp. T-0311]|nr:hypothetical protein BJV82DRAFT_669884 [Fennellomyces sp. T-0311]